jgi:hypothetical protein
MTEKEKLVFTVACNVCKGEKKIAKIDINMAKSVFVTCPQCRGSGISEGVFVTPEPGLFFFCHYFVKNVAVTTVQVLIEYIQDKNNSYFIIKIMNMFTQEEHRKKGYCTKVIQKLKQWENGKVKFILTNWQDSKENSRSLLLKEGFVNERDTHLIWRRDKKIECPIQN